MMKSLYSVDPENGRWIVYKNNVFVIGFSNENDAQAFVNNLKLNDKLEQLAQEIYEDEIAIDKKREELKRLNEKILQQSKNISMSNM